jgi:histone deacetylase 1/2
LTPSLRLNNVLVSPKLIKNLISVRQFTIDNNCSVEFDPFGCSVKDLLTRTEIARCNSPGPLYPLRLPPAAHSLVAGSTSLLWHRRLGHPGHEALSKLSSVLHLCNKDNSPSVCHACQLGRHIRLPFHTSGSRASSAFDLIHCDLWTSPVISVSGYKYYLVTLDDYSHFLWTFPLKLKSDTFPTLSHFFAYAHTQFGASIKAIQCDNGREFDNSSSRTFFLTHGAQLRMSCPYTSAIQCDNGREFDNSSSRTAFLTHGAQLRMSCPYTSAQNGKAERIIRSTNNMICSLLFQAHAPAAYWAEALHTATHLLNVLPTKTLRFSTPHLALFGIEPVYDHLRVFG